VVESVQERRGDNQFIPATQRNTADFRRQVLLLDTLVWSRSIEKLAMKYAMQLLLIENEGLCRENGIDAVNSTVF